MGITCRNSYSSDRQGELPNIGSGGVYSSFVLGSLQICPRKTSVFRWLDQLRSAIYYDTGGEQNGVCYSCCNNKNNNFPWPPHPPPGLCRGLLQTHRRDGREAAASSKGVSKVGGHTVSGARQGKQFWFLRGALFHAFCSATLCSLEFRPQPNRSIFREIGLSNATHGCPPSAALAKLSPDTRKYEATISRLSSTPVKMYAYGPVKTPLEGSSSPCIRLTDHHGARSLHEWR